jgi:protein regulator of cytokinesis 1
MATKPAAKALTDILNSLYTHLHAQTQLLPTLHSQLGLSPNALEDDLKILQQELIEGVEKRVHARRMEVEDWLSRCETAERKCVRYSRALGGNAKSTVINLGELRKETVLPRRFELVVEHQEKLRRVRPMFSNTFTQLICCILALLLKT